MKKTILLYGVSLALLILLLKILQYKYLIMDLSVEVYVGLIAAVFTVTGIWAGSKFLPPKIKEVIIPVEVAVTDFTLNESALKKSGLSSREMEVLQLMALGYSNQEIADKIFISVSTVKSHVSGILLKLEARRRTQAIQKAKELSIIA
jgi:two-component system, NarL family, response regulator LiaR